MSEGKGVGDNLCPGGEIAQREEGAAKEEHRCNEEEDRQVEDFNGRDDGGADHAGAGKRQAAEKGDRQQKEGAGIM